MWIKKKQNKGFSLIELLFVIAVIGMLATLSLVAINNAREKARDTRRLSDINQILQALELYFSSHRTYPAGDGIVLGSTNYKCLNAEGWKQVGCTNPYMDNILPNPLPGGADYLYYYINPTNFIITFKLDYGAGGYSANSCCGLPATGVYCPCTYP